MSVGRDYFAATLLFDGRVLIAGGMRRGTTLMSAEIYDPRADRWMDAAPMHFARYQHTATLLADGRVLMAGGASSVEDEIYEPTLNRWAPADLLSDPSNRTHENHSMTRLADGRVLMVGSGGAGTCACGVFDPGTYEPKPSSRWTPAPPMYADRNGHTMTLLPDGRVLIVGFRTAHRSILPRSTIRGLTPVSIRSR